LSNPDEKTLSRGNDGLFNTNGPVVPDLTIKVVNGALENSNVNVVQGMVNMISLARQFDIQMQLLKNAENSDQQAAQIYRLN
jgi:flagellar basal-body rod protein FlgF